MLADGSYGIHGVYLGLPARLGRTGVREIVELPLAADELAALREAAERIRDRLAEIEASEPAGRERTGEHRSARGAEPVRTRPSVRAAP